MLTEQCCAMMRLSFGVVRCQNPGEVLLDGQWFCNFHDPALLSEQRLAANVPVRALEARVARLEAALLARVARLEKAMEDRRCQTCGGIGYHRDGCAALAEGGAP